MSDALSYLLFTEIKNRIVNFLKRPLNWVYLLLFFGLMALNVVGAHEGSAGDIRDVRELYAIIGALYIAMFVLTAHKGATRGASLFRMPDVQMIFPAPISARRILLHGLIRQMGNSLLIGFFILFQYSWLNNVYGISIGFLLLILVGYAMAIFAGQLTAMTVFSMTSDHPGRRRWFQWALYTLLAVVVLGAGMQVLQMPPEVDLFTRLGIGFSSPVAHWFPVGGWLMAALEGISTGNALKIIVFPLMYIAYIGLLIAASQKIQSDYYEDVLSATETTHNAQIAQREGQLPTAVPENVKLGKTGIGKGWGASVLFYKHQLEQRRARAFLLSRITIIYMIITIVYAFFTRELGLLAVLIFSTYMQLFSVNLTGRWVRELALPYLYLMPERPFKKLMYCLKQPLIELLVEAVIAFVAIGLLYALSPLEIAIAVLMRFSFAVLFLAASLLVERIFPAIKSKGLIIFMLLLAAVLLMLPGVALAVGLSFSAIEIISPIMTTILALTLGNLIAAPVGFYLCRNMLDHAEVN